MSKPAKKIPNKSAALSCGLFTKRVAAAAVVAGTHNIHSSPLGTQDPNAKLTQTALEKNAVPTYSWEKPSNTQQIVLTKSEDRKQLIQKVTSSSPVATKRRMSEKICSVLEELITNGIYHSYHTAQGKEKYSRRQQIALTPQEHIVVEFGSNDDGVYLTVTDQGGSLEFQDIVSSFERCYGDEKLQIQAKSGGAGLGIYMVFELTTHLKMVRTAGKHTKISVWIPAKNEDPDTFSFNFFEGCHE